MAPAWQARPNSTFPADVRLFAAGLYWIDVPMILTVYREGNGDIHLGTAYVDGFRLNGCAQESVNCAPVEVGGELVRQTNSIDDPDVTKPADSIGLEAALLRQAERDVATVLAQAAADAIAKVEGNWLEDAATDAAREAA